MIAKEAPSARFSPDREYRYLLARDIGFAGTRACMFVMLNPSTADEHKDDPTIRRCISFARAWGYRTLYVTNLSPLRATNPKVLLVSGPEPEDVWQENMENILGTAMYCGLVVAAWGVHGVAERRADQVMAELSPLKGVGCLGTTKDGHPRHPLYVPAATPLIHYRHGAKTL